MISMHTCPLATLGGKETGGMNVYIRDLSRELIRRGHSVDIFTRYQNPHLKRVSHDLGHNARVIHIPAGPEKPLDKNVVFNYVPDFADGVISFAAKEGTFYDVIHSHYWLSGWASRSLREAWKIPIIQMFHTLGHMKNSIARSEQEKESRQRIAAERQIMAFADLLIASTPMERAQMAWLYGADPGKISIVPCGVDTDLFSPKSKSEARAFLNLPEHQSTILFVGRIEPLKGIDTLIKAIDIVLGRSEKGTGIQDAPLFAPPIGDDGQPPTLLIIGGTPEDSPTTHSREIQRLLALREELGLTNQITFLGSKPQEVLSYYYSAADILVVPSHYESFGMVALEAMACGTPVIASKVGGLSLAVQDGITGYLVPNGDPARLAEKIRSLLSQPQLAQSISRQATEWAQQFRWSFIAQRLLDIYDEVLPQVPDATMGRRVCQCQCD